jgi:hypothetical protein
VLGWGGRVVLLYVVDDAGVNVDDDELKSDGAVVVAMGVDRMDAVPVPQVD